jgi:very-short-patch-repair endonuclease
MPENFEIEKIKPFDKDVYVAKIHDVLIRRNFIHNLPHNPNLDARTKLLRKAGVLSEVIFWKQVNKGQFWNIDFDRQRIIGSYIVDFYIKSLGLAIEIDGSSHNNKQEYDAKRQAFIESIGIRMFRVSDKRIKKEISAVMQELENFIVNEYGEKM